MENNIDSSNLSMAEISVMSNVKEEKSSPKNFLNKFILFGMVIFVIIVVGISVVNFGSFVLKEDQRVINAKTNHNQDVQKLTNQ